MITGRKKECDIVNLVEKVTQSQIRKDLPEFRVGDTIIVDVVIKEGNRERVQAFEGLVIAIKGSGISKTFTVRKISNGVGVERTFPMNSPVIKRIRVVSKGKVRRAKLNYVRKSVKQTRIKDRK
ncbi:MAG: 50S ribosomal protein L19 [Mollicutes bacterium]|nr:50S ribosomal protein L19 [Mollicutes bacterium]